VAGNLVHRYSMYQPIDCELAIVNISSYPVKVTTIDSKVTCPACLEKIAAKKVERFVIAKSQGYK
jgi:hypothetical protein